MSPGRRSSLMSGWRRITPLPEQGASTSTRSNERGGQRRHLRREVRGDQQRLASRRARDCRARAAAAAGRRSAATSSPSAGVRCAMCSVLPPGAAQASSTRMPGRASSNGAASCARAVLHGNRARLETGQHLHGGGMFQHHGIGVPVDGVRLATQRAPGAQEVRDRAAAPDRRRSAIGGCWLFAASMIRRRSPQAAVMRIDQPARMRMAPGRVRVARWLTTPARCATKRRSTALTMPLARASPTMRLASTARCTCASGAPREYSTWCAAVTSRAASFGDNSANGRLTSGSSAGASRRYQRNVPSAIARTAARSTRVCAASRAASAERPSCATACTASAACARVSAPGAWRWRGGWRRRPARARPVLHAPNLMPVETHGVGEIARRHRTFAGALQLAHREHALAAGHAQAVVGDA